MRTLVRLASAVVIAAVPLIVMAGPAAASPATITVDPNPVAQGAPLTFSGNGCVARSPEAQGLEQVTITFSDSSEPFVVTPDEDGNWTVTGRVNQDAKLGDYTINATCDTYTDSFDYATATVTVIAGGPEITIWGYQGTPQIKQGASVKISGTGFDPEEQVEVVLHSTPVVLATWIADGDGNVSGTVTIPTDAELGNHTITLTGDTSGLTASEEIIVIAASSEPTTPTSAVSNPTAAPTTPAPPQLAATGVAASGMAAAGVGLAALGGGALLIARRRSSREH